MADSNEPAPSQEREPEALNIEVSALPSVDADGAGYGPWYRQSVSMPRGLVAVAVVMIIVLALLSAPISSALGARGRHLAPVPSAAHSNANSRMIIVTPTATPSPSPSPYPTATLVVPLLGAFPATCPQGAALVPFDTATIIPGIGGTDVWMMGPFSGPRATAHRATLHSSDYTPLGWPLQIQVAIASTVTQPIILTGRDLRTGYPLWFQASAPTPATLATSSLTIDPAQLQSSTGDGKWLLWFGVLYLPGASCYVIRSAWAGGGWTANLAAGR